MFGWFTGKIELSCIRSVILFVIIVLTTIIRYNLNNILQDDYAFVFYLILTVFFSWKCSIIEGLICFVFGYIVVIFLFIRPLDVKDFIGLFMYTIAGTSIICTTNHLKNSQKLLMNADAAKDQFLAILAHELRNPMSVIRNCIDIFKKQPDNCQALLLMEKQFMNMQMLLNDMSDLSRMKANKIVLVKSRVNLKTLIDVSLLSIAKKAEEKAHCFDADVEDVDIYVDPLRFEQIILNLLLNAIKYTPGRGHIKIRGKLENHKVVVAISDNGCGIPDDMIDKIFDLFVQVKENMAFSRGGLGIGLTIVKHLVELHGGTISVRSRVNEGTTFTVELPN